MSDDGEEREVSALPETSKIRHSQRPDGSQVWLIPKGGKLGIGCFAFLWVGFISIFTAVMISSLLGGVEGDVDSPWMLLFMLPFWLVGFFLVKLYLRQQQTDTLIEGFEDRFVITRKTLNRKGKALSFSFAELSSVERVVFYTQNYQPVYGVELRGEGKKKFRFGSGLESDEQHWLVGRLRDAAGLVREFPVSHERKDVEVGEAVMTSPNGGELREFKSKFLSLELLGGGAFRITKPDRTGKGLMIAGLIGAAILSVIWSKQSLPQMPEDGFDWIGLVFDSIGLVVLGVATLIFVIVLLSGVKRLGLVMLYEFTPDGLVVTEKRASTRKQTRYSRAELGDVVSKETGRSNAQIRYSLTLKTKAPAGGGKKRRSIELCRWMPMEELRVMEEAVRVWKG